MDDALRMGVSQRLSDLLEYFKESWKFRRGRRPLAQEFRQGPPLDQLHAEVGAPVGQMSQLVDGRNSRVLQLARHARLFEEAPFGARAGPAQQYLNRTR